MIQKVPETANLFAARISLQDCPGFNFDSPKFNYKSYKYFIRKGSTSVINNISVNDNIVKIVLSLTVVRTS